MYIAMNRFPVVEGAEGTFEEIWRTRESQLDKVPGFERFRLLRGHTHEGITTFVSHSEWASEEAFIAWTESEAFKAAHGKARAPEGTYAGHPVFEGYKVVL